MPFTTLDLSKQSGTSLPSSIVTASGLTLGITGYDEWIVTTNFTGDADPITSNWSRNPANTFEKIGTGMSQSSGIFTFPETGKWNIEFTAVNANNNGDDRNIGIMIQKTVNNNTYDEASISEGSIARNSAATWYVSGFTTALVDVQFECDSLGPKLQL